MTGGPVRACSARSPLLGVFCVLLLGSCSGSFSQTPSAGGWVGALLLGSGSGRLSPTPGGWFIASLLGSGSGRLKPIPSLGGAERCVAGVRFGPLQSDLLPRGVFSALLVGCGSGFGVVQCSVAGVRFGSVPSEPLPWGCLLFCYWVPVGF